MAALVSLISSIHWNWPKTCLLLACLSLLVWVLVSRQALVTLARIVKRLDTAGLGQHRRWAWISGALFGSLLAYLKCRQYFELQTMWDMAVESNVAWHMVHGPWFYNSLDDRNHLGQHFAPVFFLLGALYRIYESPLTLLILQSLALGLAVVAVYYLGLIRTPSPAWAPSLTLLFAINWFVHEANAHDFHRVVLGVPLLLWLLYGVEKEWRAGVIALSMLVLSLEEGMAPILVGVGLYLMGFRPGWRRQGGALVLCSLAYFVVVTKVLMPMFSPENGLFFWSRYDHLGQNLQDALLNLLMNPAWAIQQAIFERNQYVRVFYLLATMGFLPLLAWKEMLLAVIPLAINLLSNASGQYHLGHHYSATIMPFMFYAGAAATAKGSPWLEKLAQNRNGWLRLLGGLAILAVAWNIYRLPNYDLGKTSPEFIASTRAIVLQIPQEASLAADVRFLPLLVNRHRICRTELVEDSVCATVPVGAEVKRESRGQMARPTRHEHIPAFVLIGTDPVGTGPAEAQKRERFVRALIDSGRYGLLERRETIYLLRKSDTSHLGTG